MPVVELLSPAIGSHPGQLDGYNTVPLTATTGLVIRSRKRALRRTRRVDHAVWVRRVERADASHGRAITSYTPVASDTAQHLEAILGTSPGALRNNVLLNVACGEAPRVTLVESTPGGGVRTVVVCGHRALTKVTKALWYHNELPEKAYDIDSDIYIQSLRRVGADDDVIERARVLLAQHSERYYVPAP